MFTVYRRQVEKHKHTLNNDLHTNVPMGRNVSFVLMTNVPTPITTCTYKNIEFFKEWPGRGETEYITVYRQYVPR